MKAKTKQETTCCQDLAVRCAKAELERDAAKAEAADARKWSKMTAEAYGRQELRVQEKHEQLDGVRRQLMEALLAKETLKQTNDALQQVNEALCRPKAWYECERPIVVEPGLDWSFVLFFLCLATGVATWIAGFVWLCVRLAGWFA